MNFVHDGDAIGMIERGITRLSYRWFDSPVDLDMIVPVTA